MCLGIPGRITTIVDDHGMRMGKVDFGGISRQVCLAYVPDACEGQYVIVHAGFAINVLDEHDAQQTLALLREARGAGLEDDA